MIIIVTIDYSATHYKFVRTVTKLNLFFRTFASFLIGSAAFFSCSFMEAAQAVLPTTYYIVNGVTSDSDPQLPYEDLKKSEPYSPWYNRFTDYALGYVICYPRDMKVDASLSSVRTVFSNDTTQIEVYSDKLDGDPQSTASYLADSDKFTDNRYDHAVLSESRFAQNGFQIHFLKWTRHRLATVPNDKNNYVSIELVKNNRDAFTILIKSADPIANEMQILNSFQTVAKKGIAGMYDHHEVVSQPLNDETKAFQKKYLSPGSPLRWGIYEVNAPEDFSYLDQLENYLNYTFPIVIRYQSLDEPFPEKSLQNAYSHKKFAELSLQTFHYQQNNQSVLYEILDGKYDDYFTTYAKAVKKFSHPILLRLDNEMNGQWCPYSSFYFSKDTDLFKEVWHHIYNIFKANQVNNVLWVWNPNDESSPRPKWNNYLNYYPGDNYVDVIGMTGYNSGTAVPGEPWREFADIYQPLYAQYARYFDQPMIIGEFGCASVGGDKPSWMQKMFDQIGQYDRIKVAIWWDYNDYDSAGNITHNYRMDDNLAVKETFRQGLSSFQETQKVLK